MPFPVRASRIFFLRGVFEPTKTTSCFRCIELMVEDGVDGRAWQREYPLRPETFVYEKVGRVMGKGIVEGVKIEGKLLATGDRRLVMAFGGSDLFSIPNGGYARN